MVLTSNQVIYPTFTPSGVRIDVVPSVSTFLANVQQEISFFQSYRISNVMVELLPTKNVNTSDVAVPVTTTSGFYYANLPLFATVRLTSDEIPNSSLDAFMSYKNVQLHVLNRPYRYSFKPVVPSSSNVQDQGLTTFVNSPRLSSKDVNHLHFGQSFFFYQIPQSSSGIVQATNIPMRIQCQI